MRRPACVHLLLLVAATLLYICVSAQQKEGWYGTITYTWRTTSKSPTRTATSEHVYTAEIENGRAVTKASEKVTMRQSMMCDISWDGYAEGTGTADFDLEVDEEGSFYIEVPMPVIKGKKTISYASSCGGGQKVEPMEMGDIALAIEGKDNDNDPNVLSGDSTLRNVTKGGSNEVMEEVFIINWSLTRGPSEADLIVTPQAYDTWLPLPGKSEKEAGGRLLVSLQLVGKDGKPSKLKAKYFELELKGTSKEPGIALNAPLQAAATPAFDLAFEPLEGARLEEKGQKMEVFPSDGTSASVAILSYDGGAYTTLVATAVLPGGRRIRGMLLKKGGEKEILVPRRSGGSLIADAWKKLYGNPEDSDDKEKSPGNENDGDGLTAYEEYRGVMTTGQFKRLNPNKKELGVQLAKEQETAFKGGLDLFAKASGIDVILLYKDELSPDRILNKNSASAKASVQHALLLEATTLPEGVMGRNDPKERLKKTPKQSEKVVIDLAQFQTHQKELEASCTAAGISVPYTLEQNKAVTIAHELAHGVYLDHHGKPSQEINRTASAGSAVPFRIYATDGSEVKERPFNIEGRVGTDGNEASGDLSCIMAYNSVYQWAYHKAADGSLVYYAVPPLPTGTRFCQSDEPTGINTSGHFFGKATTGNCLSRLKVRDEP